MLAPLVKSFERCLVDFRKDSLEILRPQADQRKWSRCCWPLTYLRKLLKAETPIPIDGLGVFLHLRCIFDVFLFAKDEVDEGGDVGYGDGAVAVDVGCGLVIAAVARLFAKNDVYEGRGVGHGDFAIAVDIAVDDR